MFLDSNPTAENIVVVIWNKLRKIKPELDLSCLYETHLEIL
jgi:6-pyruvoyltetrahydropterin/6-carboxytetrahydropterin synthase